jgi:glutamate synthase domain-containing protein 1
MDLFKSFIAICLFASSLGFLHLNKRASFRQHVKGGLHMAIYSSDKGIPAALVEERDACGVGFIASRSNEASYHILEQAIVGLGCMEHRGATSADNISGDGAGVMTAIPWKLFKDYISVDTCKNKDGSIGCGVVQLFLPKSPVEMKAAIEEVEKICNEVGLANAGWRDVPVDPSVLGSLSADFAPVIKQFFIRALPGNEFANQAEFENKLYSFRRFIQVIIFNLLIVCVILLSLSPPLSLYAYVMVMAFICRESCLLQCHYHNRLISN